MHVRLVETQAQKRGVLVPSHGRMLCLEVNVRNAIATIRPGLEVAVMSSQRADPESHERRFVRGEQAPGVEDQWCQQDAIAMIMRVSFLASYFHILSTCVSPRS